MAEETSARVALQVINRGMDLENVYALLGGLGAWQTAGYPVESGGN
jgi:rhodanese-related sulfurtransferase